MKTGFKTKLTLLVAAAAGFVAGRWGNSETKDRLTQRFKVKQIDQRPAAGDVDVMHGEVTLDEYELLSFHN
ncbi:hypothetical protein [Parasegetibacter sp. NRK P23]|uniref:hypothetical protein n=1 Tax=Parasegetibacter sp. NRK P23 TaxID=2942999 RepID=UPI0020442E36|nr:hypothetical protein [Parasegetibacter sp. NRK P23]MCM5529430.1 hypothetical protein [Parasegetibacter sp. NRK P23]